VRNRAVQLFREMQSVHNLPEEYSFWLEAAALMHEVGKFMNYQGTIGIRNTSLRIQNCMICA